MRVLSDFIWVFCAPVFVLEYIMPPPRGIGRPHREGHRRYRGARGRPLRACGPRTDEGPGAPAHEGHRRRRGARGRLPRGLGRPQREVHRRRPPGGREGGGEGGRGVDQMLLTTNHYSIKRERKYDKTNKNKV